MKEPIPINCVKLFLTNTSRYSDNEVRWLVGFAERYVASEAKRGNWQPRMELLPWWVQFKNKEHGHYGGLFYHEPGQPDGVRRRRVLVKIGRPEKFPLALHQDRRYKDTPAFEANDWQECAVAISAHEMAHAYFPGGKEGEFNCDLVMDDAVREFRKCRHEYAAHCSAMAARAERRELALAAKKSPQYVANKKFKDAQAKLVRWRRKLKLATTKAKHYERAVRRAERQLEQLNQRGRL